MPQQKTQRINGTDYVYIDEPYWNADKKRGEHKRKYIGKMVNGEFVPNKNYLLMQELENKASVPAKTGPVPATECTRKFYGATYLLDRIADQTGIGTDLERCFGVLSKQILSILLTVAMTILRHRSLLSSATRWKSIISKI